VTPRDRALIEEAARRLRPLLKGAKRIALCTHINPDGDGIGSEICLLHHLVSLGIETRIINTEALPLRYRFLDPEGAAEVFDAKRHEPFLKTADLVFMLDNSSPARLGPLEAAVRGSSATTVCIDHHNLIDPFWKVNIIDEEACATGELVFQIVKALGGAVNRLAAQAAYVSLVTDTGYFRFSKTSPRCHEAAAEMLALGVEPPRVYQEVYERNSPALVRLGGVAMAGLELLEEGRLGCITLTRAQLAACRGEQEDTSEIINELLSIDGVRAAVLFKELDGNRVKLSFRSKGSIDVNHLASRFGGGGHKNAAGAVIEGSLEEVTRRVLGPFREIVRRPA